MRIVLTILFAAGLALLLTQALVPEVVWAGPSRACCP